CDLRATDNPAMLLAHCRGLREQLAPSSELRGVTTASGPAYLREIWAAMRRIGGEVPPTPDILRRFSEADENALFVAAITDRLHTLINPEEVLSAIDTAVSWCLQREAISGSAPATPQAERGRVPETIEEIQRAAETLENVVLDWKVWLFEYGRSI